MFKVPKSLVFLPQRCYSNSRLSSLGQSAKWLRGVREARKEDQRHAFLDMHASLRSSHFTHKHKRSMAESINCLF